MYKEKIQTQFLFFVKILVGIFVFGCILLIYLNKRQTNILNIQSLNEFELSITNSLKSKSSAIEFSVKDFTYWDEMVAYALNPSENWYQINIEASLTQPLKLDSIWILNKEQQQLNTSKPPFNKSFLYNKSFLDALHQKRYIHFFNIKDSVVIEYFAATIHHSDDLKREKDPFGYFIVAKIWNNQFISELELLSACNIEIKKGNLKVTSESKNFKLYVVKNLTNWDNTVTASAYFMRTDELASVTYSFNFKLLALFVIFWLLMILAVLYFFRTRVNKPLKAISEMLVNEHDKKTEYLLRSGAEFREIAILYKNFLKQKQELKSAKIKAEESDKLKSAFLSNISHEVRTPMNAIVGFATLLKSAEKLDDNKTQEFADIIFTNSNMLLEVFSDILDIARIESGELELNKHRFSIRDVIFEIQSIFKTKVEAKLLNFEFVPFNTTDDYFVETDAGRVKQVLVNLLNNALKFTNKGSITFGYTIEDKWIHIYIRDTGIGINDDEKKIIFEPFRQVETVLSKRYPGTGLGLSIANSLTILLGGELFFESQPSVGTWFSIRFPLISNEPK